MIGDKLRAERERQNLTIKDIEQGTSIRALYIECIEKGDYGQLPGEVYAKGFIRNYASYLKMDASALLKEFHEEQHPGAAAAAEEIAEKGKMDMPGDQETEPFSTGTDYHNRIEESHHRQNMFLAAAICLVVAGGAYFMLSSSSGEEAKPAKQVVQPAKQANSAQPKNEQKGQAAAAPKYDDVEVTAKFADRCWTQVVADGKTVYEGTMEKGKTMQWKGKEKVAITAGNAGAVSLSVNGKDMGQVGDNGQVIEKVFTKDGANADGKTAAQGSEQKDKKK